MAKCTGEVEVFSRTCGYHRPIKNWNPGKQEEFNDRVVFNVNGFLNKKKEIVKV